MLESLYPDLVTRLRRLVETARRSSARAVNAVMTATYWEIGRRIVQFEQRGEKRAAYGEELLKRLSDDLTAHFGRGFGVDNLELFRAFYLTYPESHRRSDLAGKSESPIRISDGHKGTVREIRIGDSDFRPIGASQSIPADVDALRAFAATEP